VAFIVLVVLGALACIAALAVFVIFGSIPGEGTTAQEDWIFSALCCLLPIGGFGAILVGAGAIVWFRRLKDR
jgi:hypothetical protein